MLVDFIRARELLFFGFLFRHLDIHSNGTYSIF